MIVTACKTQQRERDTGGGAIPKDAIATSSHEIVKIRTRDLKIGMERKGAISELLKTVF